MHAISAEQLVADLVDAQIGATFNQYRETGGDDASPEAPRLRIENLIRYLNAKPPDAVVLVAEAAGWRGARYSGLPLYSERQIDEAASPLRRTSTHPRGWCEPSATVVQSAIAPWAQYVILWNAVPTHTRRGRAHHTNRPPTRGELTEGALFVRRLLGAVQPRHVAAIGRSAAWVLGSGVPAVRHPSHGGAHECRRGLRELLTMWLGDA